MKYSVTIDGHAHLVEIDGVDVRIDGERVHARMAEVTGTPAVLITVANEGHTIVVDRGKERGHYSLFTDRFRFDVEAIDERTQAIRALAAARSAKSGPTPLIAPMPGLVVRVNVEVGDVVQAGQGLVVMEAMKMENELRTASAGTVRTVRAAPGTVVEKGMVLVELD